MAAQVDLGSSRAGIGQVPNEHLPVPSKRIFFLLLGLLFTAHIGLRLWITPIAELDESWQLVLSQHWAWGYHAHPPLYTWLQIVCFRVFGESIFTLALLKNGLLFALYGFTYASARTLTRRHDLAVFATLALFLVPQISWESQRDLTHSVLLSTTAAATLYCFLRLAERPSATRYALLGAAVGLTLLSKYNSGVFLLGGMVAALIVPRYRAVLLDRRIVLTGATCLAIAGPHFAWIYQHANDAFSRTDKLVFRPGTTYGAIIGRLLWRIPNAALPNLLPLAGIYLLANWGPRLTSGARREWFTLRNDPARLIFWAALISVLLLSAGMLASKATSVRGRWFQPMFVWGAVLLIAQLQTIPRWLYKLVASLALLTIVAVMILLPFNVRGGGSKGQDLTAATVANIVAAAGEDLRRADVILADEFWVAGNMRLTFGKTVVLPEAAQTLPKGSRHIVAVYERTSANQPRKEFREFVDRYLGHAATWRLIHLTPDDDRRRTGMRVGVAEIN